MRAVSHLLPASAAPASGSAVDSDPVGSSLACQRYDCTLLVPALTRCVRGRELQKRALKREEDLISQNTPCRWRRLKGWDHGCVDHVQTCRWVFRPCHILDLVRILFEGITFFFNSEPPHCWCNPIKRKPDQVVNAQVFSKLSHPCSNIWRSGIPFFISSNFWNVNIFYLKYLIREDFSTIFVNAIFEMCLHLYY